LLQAVFSSAGFIFVGLYLMVSDIVGKICLRVELAQKLQK